MFWLGSWRVCGAQCILRHSTPLLTRVPCIDDDLGSTDATVAMQVRSNGHASRYSRLANLYPTRPSNLYRSTPLAARQADHLLYALLLHLLVHLKVILYFSPETLLKLCLPRIPTERALLVLPEVALEDASRAGREEVLVHDRRGDHQTVHDELFEGLVESRRDRVEGERVGEERQLATAQFGPAVRERLESAGQTSLVFGIVIGWGGLPRENPVLLLQIEVELVSYLSDWVERSLRGVARTFTCEGHASRFNLSETGTVRAVRLASRELDRFGQGLETCLTQQNGTGTFGRTLDDLLGWDPAWSARDNLPIPGICWGRNDPLSPTHPLLTIPSCAASMSSTRGVRWLM